MNVLSFIHRHKYFIILFLIAFVLRVIGIDWDEGMHFHPDERMLIMVADRVNFFTQLNPDFFNYGSLPVYILKGTSQLLSLALQTNIATYDGMLYVGRALSLINDLIVIGLIYNISHFLFNKKYAALAAVFFYVFAFFPIQNTHFFIVDTFLNVFTTTLIYLLLKYLKDQTIKKAALIGIIFAAAITTKVTALLFSPIIVLVVFLATHGKMKHRIIDTAQHGAIILCTTLLFSFIFMPFAFIELTQFLNEISMQLKMNSDPYIFPYTLQYVGTLPYWYYLKNIAIWGLGPFISAFFLLGVYEHGVQFSIANIKKSYAKNHKHVWTFVIFYLFYIVYFVVIGKSAVKFMRYMLLMYPFFSILAGYGAYELFASMSTKMRKVILPLTFGLVILWTLAFVNIYSQRTTRLRASNWIYSYIPTGSTLAVEHWDDRVPVFDIGRYNYQELTLYDRPDDEIKWQVLNQKLASSDYIVIASNRLYVPLQKLNDCEKYTSCYPITAQYYKDLFEGKRGFTKVAEFSSYPNLPLGPWTFEIIDDAADESFTVYDHPKIMIFKKVNE